MMTDQEISDLILEKTGGESDGIKLRSEYQPNGIAEYFNSALGEPEALKTIIGCGGGKTLMMSSAMILLMLYGEKKKFVFTAPTLALCRQLEVEFLTFIKKWSKTIKLPNIQLINVSSDRKLKNEEDVNKEEDEINKEDIKELDIEIKKLSEETGQTYFQDTVKNHDEIIKYITNEEVTFFFVCLPSFKIDFMPLVIKNQLKIDVTSYDEFHNLITQKKTLKKQKKSTKELLNDYAKYSHSNWFFSASKKHIGSTVNGEENFTWKDKIFGRQVFAKDGTEVTSAKLVELGYLVKTLKITLIEVKQLHGIIKALESGAITENFRQKKIVPKKFYQETAAILATAQDQLYKRTGKPKILCFNSTVKHIEELLKDNYTFKEKMNELMEQKVLLNSITSDTPADERVDILDKIRNATIEIAVILLNHSCIKEGIDCPSFDVALICRGMGDIAIQQALGRIQRSKIGKECAYLYILADRDERKMHVLADRLHYGIGNHPAVFYECLDERVGNEPIKKTDADMPDVNHEVLDAEVELTEVLGIGMKKREKKEYAKNLSIKELIGQNYDEDYASEISEKFDKIYSKGLKKVWTPFPLCKEMINKIPNLEGNILVFSDLGFIPTLKWEGVDLNIVTCIVHEKEQEEMAIKMGVGKVINIGYNIEKFDKLNMKFDIVLGNPPFNGQKIGGGAGSGNAIWQKFVDFAFNLLKANGYLLFIHPNSWRFGERKKLLKVKNIIFSNQIKYAVLQFPFPGAGVMVDWYILHKIIPNIKAEIKFIDGEKTITWPPEKNILHNFHSIIKNSIIKKVLTEENNGLFERKAWGGLSILDNSIKGEFKFAHGSEHIQNPPRWKIKPNPHIYQNRRKVIFCATRQFRAIVDDGNLGIGDHVHYLLENDRNKAEFIVSIANSKLMCFLQSLFSDTFFDPKSWAQWNNPNPLKQIHLESKGFLSDEQIYNHFNLSNEEISFIEKTIL